MHFSYYYAFDNAISFYERSLIVSKQLLKIIENYPSYKANRVHVNRNSKTEKE